MWPSEHQDAAVAGARSVASAAAAATALVETSKYTLQRMRKEGAGRMGEVFFCPFIFLATASR